MELLKVIITIIYLDEKRKVTYKLRRSFRLPSRSGVFVLCQTTFHRKLLSNTHSVISLLNKSIVESIKYVTFINEFSTN